MSRFRMNRRKLPMNRKQAKKRFLLISLIIFSLLSLQSFILIENQLAPALMEIAKVRTRQIATQAINDAISKKIAQNTNFDELVDTVRDNDGEVSMLMFNTMEYARILGEASYRVQYILHTLQNESQPIPLGMALNSNILAQIGPDVPIEILPMGSVTVELLPEQKSVGINTIVVTVYIIITAEVRVVIPFATETEVVYSKIPVSHATIMGKIPEFYYDSNGDSTGNMNEPKINFGPSINPRNDSQ